MCNKQSIARQYNFVLKYKLVKNLRCSTIVFDEKKLDNFLLKPNPCMLADSAKRLHLYSFIRDVLLVFFVILISTTVCSR